MEQRSGDRPSPSASCGRRRSKARLRSTVESVSYDRPLRVVTLGSDRPHPLTRAALSVVEELECLEHVDHLTANDEREFLRDVRSPAYREHIAGLAPDLLVSAAYARIVPDDVLGLATIGAINVHPSLLPEYRGVGAVWWAIYEGRSTVGVTIHQMTVLVDTGPILAQSVPQRDPGRRTRRSLAHARRPGPAASPNDDREDPRDWTNRRNTPAGWRLVSKPAAQGASASGARLVAIGGRAPAPQPDLPRMHQHPGFALARLRKPHRHSRSDGPPGRLDPAPPASQHRGSGRQRHLGASRPRAAGSGLAEAVPPPPDDRPVPIAPQQHQPRRGQARTTHGWRGHLGTEGGEAAQSRLVRRPESPELSLRVEAPAVEPVSMASVGHTDQCHAPVRHRAPCV